MSSRAAVHFRRLQEANADGRLAGLVGDGAEGWAYLEACEAAPAGDIELSSLRVDGPAGPAGFAPCFVAPFQWLPNPGKGRNWPGWVQELSSIRLAAIGSPHANELGVRLDDALDLPDREAVFEALLDGLEMWGADEDAHMLLVKDVNDRDVGVADPILRRAGYVRMVAPPLAYLHLPFDSAEAWLKAFSHRKRKDILRNHAKSGDVSAEIPGDIAGLSDQLNALADETRERADTQFGGLEGSSPAFFQALAEKAGEQAVFALYRLDERLVGFSLMLVDTQQVFGKTIGLHYPEAREHKIYFRNLLEGIELTTARGLQWLCMGQLGYTTKLHVGAKLEKRWYYLKMRGRYAAGFGFYKRFLEGRRVETESAEFDMPERFFASDPGGPQPPAHLMFGTDGKDKRSNG